MDTPTNTVKVEAFDASRMPWQVLMLRYPAGFTNEWHCHTHGHGMYVLDGQDA